MHDVRTHPIVFLMRDGEEDRKEKEDEQKEDEQNQDVYVRFSQT